MLRKNLLVFVILACTLSASKADDVTGGVTILTGAEFQNAVKELKVSLNKVAALNGPAYTVSKVNKATFQVVEGYITRYIAMLRNKNNVTRRCNVEIWERSWVPKGTKVTIACNGLKKYVIRYD